MGLIRKGILCRAREELAEVPNVSFASFVRLSYAVARELHANVESLTEDEVGNNYYYAVIRTKSVTFNLLCNTHYPLVGITELFKLPPPNLHTRFISRADVEQVVTDYGGFEVISLDDLNRGVSQEELKCLLPSELNYIKVWNPKCIGEIVFNINN